jgi:hypothetical protein
MLTRTPWEGPFIPLHAPAAVERELTRSFVVEALPQSRHHGATFMCDLVIIAAFGINPFALVVPPARAVISVCLHDQSIRSRFTLSFSPPIAASGGMLKEK